MKNETTIKLFQSKQVRTHWNSKQEKWYFSVIDVIEVLTESDRPRKYWNDLKKKLNTEGSELSEKIGQLKLLAGDGKMRLTDVASAEQILRLIQSIPSPKVEPFKLWLAKVGYERMQEMVDPEIALNRSREYWQSHGRSEKWIQQRMMGQETRNKLTDYWNEHDVKKGEEFAILTNIIHKEWSGLSVKGHKDIKELDRQNLRDHMSEAELIFTALAELSTRNIAETDKATGLEENKDSAHEGGKISKDARIALENKIGKSVVTGQNFLKGDGKKKIKDEE